jgi:hypothetical protein
MVMVMMAIDLAGGNMLRNQLVTGETYSPAMIFGFNGLIHKSSSPWTYWVFMGCYFFFFVTGLALVAFLFREIIAEQKRRKGSSSGSIRRDR